MQRTLQALSKLLQSILSSYEISHVDLKVLVSLVLSFLSISYTLSASSIIGFPELQEQVFPFSWMDIFTVSSLSTMNIGNLFIFWHLLQFLCSKLEVFNNPNLSLAWFKWLQVISY